MSIQRIALSLCVLLAVSGRAAADPALLKSNVVIVRPHYHAETQQAFRDWSEALGQLARDAQRGGKADAAALLKMLSDYYMGQATNPGHGSGWVWIGPGGEVFVVTNKHVAGQAGSVTLEFWKDQHPSIRNGRIVYVDPNIDAAVIEVDRRDLPEAATGFELVDAPLTEGNPVWAAGFPGTATERGMLAVYSLTNGTVSTADYPMEGGVIAHTATIDPGNSGGPLLTEDPTVPLGYKVSGMNTWKAVTRTNVNLSIPVPKIRRVLQAAVSARQAGDDPARLAHSLRSTATRLADELGSSRPDFDELQGMIAYSFIAQHPNIISVPLQLFMAGKISKDKFLEYIGAPVDYCRRLVFELFYATFSTGASSVGAVRLERITDEERVGIDRPVRTIFTVGGKRQEITWAWEHGAWRISDASFEHALNLGGGGPPAPGGGGGDAEQLGRRDDGQPAAPAGAWVERKRGVALALRAGFGMRGASAVDGFASELGETESRSFDLELDIPLSRHVWITLGVGHNPLGATYDVTSEGMAFTIDEQATYLQVPAGLRLELPIARRWGTVRLFGRAAIAGDILIGKGGTFSGASGTGQLDDPSVNWYERHNTANVAALYGGGVEFGFGKAPSLYIGLDVIGQQHLLDEWTDEAFTGGANYRYTATRTGLFLKWQGLR